MIEITGLDHIVLRTSHMEEMLHFYCTVLGCPIERQLSADIGLVQLRAGDALIDLVDVDSKLGRAGGGPPTAQNNNMDHFCLQIKPKSEAEISLYLASHGIDIGPFEQRYGAQGFGHSIYLLDPDGNTVELRNRS